MLAQQSANKKTKAYPTPPHSRENKHKALPLPPQMDLPPQRVTITICGDGGTGKSSITLRLVRSQWTHEYDPTIEDSYTLTRKIDGQHYNLSLTDTAGQEEYRGMWASSNLRSDAFLLVYDITNHSSLGVLQEFHDLIEMEWETRMEAWVREANQKGQSHAREEQPIKPVKIVAGNKCDLQQSRQVLAQEGLKWAKERGCGFMETSARNTVNIEETFALIVRRVVEARRLAAGGSEVSALAKSKSRNLSVGTAHEALGTRRAVTAPLSPLPDGPEKEMARNPNTGSKRAKLKEFFRKFMCGRQ